MAKSRMNKEEVINELECLRNVLRSLITWIAQSECTDFYSQRRNPFM